MKCIIGKLSALLLASKFSFQNEKLQNAARLYDEAEELASNGEWDEACAVYMQGIFMGRKIVQNLLQDDSNCNNDNSDEAQLALDWMVSSYLECSRARIKMEDWEKARSDAWAACSYSDNKNLEVLLCMLHVCESTDDLFGELQTLKSIQTLLPLSYATVEFDVQSRILNTEQKLEEEYGKS